MSNGAPNACVKAQPNHGKDQQKAISKKYFGRPSVRTVRFSTNWSREDNPSNIATLLLFMQPYLGSCVSINKTAFCSFFFFISATWREPRALHCVRLVFVNGPIGDSQGPDQTGGATRPVPGLWCARMSPRNLHSYLN